MAYARGKKAPRRITGWTNNYYDDMAWLAIALERAERTQGVSAARAHGIDPDTATWQ
ncbi:hypothetical protein [Nocardia farcinica]|uniref:hypothetical protein n=1 Tax=Nocardia farcinica TaxID=37329 RepID=UPI002458E376|nr:hypothetical protein [Nocardia farcinica]